jgi:acetolactate synthase-1/2/3 large subunit
MTQPIRGAEILLRTLARAGTGTIFTLSGNHIMSVFDAAPGAGIELIHTRHEAAAVHMADAFARLTGQVGVALVTGGQGHANAVGALCTALAGEVPLLLLSGHAPLAELGLGAFQEIEQARLAAPLCKASLTLQSAETLAQDVAAAIRLAREGRPGPVHLSLPTDVLEAVITQAEPALDFTPAPQPPSAAAIASIRAALQAAARPLVLAPPALCTPTGKHALAALQSALGVPVLAMESPRGINDPSLGALAEMLAQADVVCLLGKALDFTLRFGKAAPQAQWLLLEPDAALIARARKGLGARLALAEACAPLAAATRLAADARPNPAQAGWLAEVQAATSHRPAGWDSLPQDGAIHPVTLLRALTPYLATPDAVLVSDGGEIGQWAQAVLSAPTRIINGVAGAIGPSIPFAMAASRARQNAPVLAVLGDGTCGFHIAEFDTAVRHNLPFVAVVGNDSRWNAEHQIQLRDFGGRTHGCTLAPATRYDLAAAAFGAHAEFVERAEDLAPALARAFVAGRPALVNVIIAGQPAPVVRRAPS